LQYTQKVVQLPFKAMMLLELNTIASIRLGLTIIFAHLLI